MIPWTQADAVAFCREIEAFAPDYGAHVALTGGTLYKDGPRKDCDVLFYCIRQVDEIDRAGLLVRIQGMGVELGKQRGWVTKATWQGKSVDLFFPEAFPASSVAALTGTY